MSLLAAYLGPSMPVTHLPNIDAEGGVLPPFGLGWYRGLGSDPIRFVHRSHSALHGADLEVPNEIASECVVAATGAPSQAPQPFRWGPLLFGFRGELERFEETLEGPLTSRLSAQARVATEARGPGAVLFMTWLEMLQGQTEIDDLADGLERTVAAVQDLALTQGVQANFRIIATNGECLVALRTGTSDELPPLYTLVGSDETPVPASGRLVTTEQAFPGSWTSLEAHSMVIFTREGE